MNRKIVITGASRGLGKAIAERFAWDGLGHTMFLCAMNEARLKDAAAEIEIAYPGVRIYTMAVDISTKEGTTAFADWVLKQTDTIDILVNNAGSFVPGSVYNEEDGALEKMMSTNLYSAYYLTRQFLPGMMKQRSGHIFNMCSIASLKAYNNGGSYSISKWALLGMTRNLREEMKPHNVKVTAVIPGAAYTDSWAATGIDPKRFMEAGDIAEMIYAASSLSPQACVEDIVVRPQLGDI